MKLSDKIGNYNANNNYSN